MRSSSGLISAANIATRDIKSASNSRRRAPTRTIRTKVANAPRLTASVPTYQIVRRAVTDLSFHRPGIRDRVPDAADCLNEAGLPRFIDLVAQVLDVDVDDVAREIECEVPYVLRDHGARQDDARTPHQVFEQRVFLGGERNRLAAALHRARRRVELQV